MNKLFINCDGGARGNPGPAAAAFVVKDLNGRLLYREGKFLGITTNNQAEYEALIMALNWAAETHPGDELVLFLDSQLVVNQMLGKFKIKVPEIIIKNRSANKLIADKKITVRQFIYVPRNVNYEADALVNETLDINRF